MDLLTIIITIIAAYGITNIVTQGAIFDPFKEKLLEMGNGSKIVEKIVYLLNCPMCFGFWVGVLLGSFFGPFAWWNIILNGAFYSATAWILHCLTRFLGSGEDPERTYNISFPYGVPLYETKNDINNEESENQDGSKKKA
jgi:hypothetical protein